jgi:hypothetical protein
MTQFLITSAARVKAQRDITGSSLDAIVDKIIAGVSQMAEEYLCRRILAGNYTDVWPLRARTRYVRMLAVPVTAVSAVRYARTRDFSAIDPMATSEYQVLLGEGQIYLSGLSTWLEPGFIQVLYTGGMAADTAAFIAAYPRIADAADNECVARLNRRAGPDGSPEAFGTSVAYADELKPLTDFYEALKPHRRIRL